MQMLRGHHQHTKGQPPLLQGHKTKTSKTITTVFL